MCKELFHLIYLVLANRSVTWSCTSAHILGRSHMPAASVRRLSGRNSCWTCTFAAIMTPTLYPHPLYAPSAERPSLAGYAILEEVWSFFQDATWCSEWCLTNCLCLWTEYHGQTCRELHWYGICWWRERNSTQKGPWRQKEEDAV